MNGKERERKRWRRQRRLSLENGILFNFIWFPKSLSQCSSSHFSTRLMHSLVPMLYVWAVREAARSFEIMHVASPSTKTAMLQLNLFPRKLLRMFGTLFIEWIEPMKVILSVLSCRQFLPIFDHSWRCSTGMVNPRCEWILVQRCTISSFFWSDFTAQDAFDLVSSHSNGTAATCWCIRHLDTFGWKVPKRIYNTNLK